MRQQPRRAGAPGVVGALLLAAYGLGATPDPIESRSASALAQGKRTAKGAPALAPFEGGYDEALARAADRNVPLIAIAIVEERDSELDADIREFRDSIFSSAPLATAAQHAVVVLASNAPHPPATVEVIEGESKTTRQVCSVYRTATCQTHQKLFDSLYAEHNVEGEFKSPNVRVVGADRKPVRAWADGHAPAWPDVLGALGEARKKAGEGLTEAQFRDVQALVPEARAAEQRGEFGGAYSAWSKVLAITQGTKYSIDARAGQAQATKELEKLRAAARTGLDAGQPIESYKSLLRLQREWNGTPFEKELARDVLAAEKHKTAKDAIAAYKRELEAEQLWSDALDLLGADNTRAAHAKLRTILRKHAGTPADKRVRERFPELAAEEDAKIGGG